MADPLNLTRFLPYQLSILQARLSHRIGGYYREHFDLSRNGWRVMAALALHGRLTARSVGAFVELEKMPVSRAVRELEARGWVSARVHESDRRASQLQLTAKGLRAYEQIVPQLLAREREVMSVLTDDERAALGAITEKLLQHLQPATEGESRPATPAPSNNR